MKIKNKSSKVISIGDVVLLPDSSKEFSNTFGDLPSVKAMVKVGLLEIEKELTRTTTAPAKEDAKAETKPEEKADDKKSDAKKETAKK